MTAVLSVNLNAVAMLRNRRDLPWPDVIHMGRLALQAGAAGLTVHPRPDERHIRFSDLSVIRSLIDKEFGAAEFNIEGYPSDSFLNLVEKYAHQITLVPDDPAQSTSDHGWDFEQSADFLAPIINRLKEKSIRVSLFANPTSQGIDIAKKIGADRVEFYTGPYGDAYDDKIKQKVELTRIEKASESAYRSGLGINAGHDLTVENLPDLVKAVPMLAEVSIGHGLIADALEYGMKETVRRFIAALS